MHAGPGAEFLCIVGIDQHAAGWLFWRSSRKYAIVSSGSANGNQVAQLLVAGKQGHQPAFGLAEVIAAQSIVRQAGRVEMEIVQNRVLDIAHAAMSAANDGSQTALGQPHAARPLSEKLAQPAAERVDLPAPIRVR